MERYNLIFETTGKGIEVSFECKITKLDLELLIEDIEAGETSYIVGECAFKKQKGVVWEVDNRSGDVIVEWNEKEITIIKENM